MCTNTNYLCEENVLTLGLQCLLQVDMVVLKAHETLIS